MRKYMIMFFVVIISLFCAQKDCAGNVADSVEYDDYQDVKEHYNRILLKEWQKNPNWQKQAGNSFDSTQNPSKRITSDNVWNTAYNVLKEYYNNVYAKIRLAGKMSFTGEHWLVRYSRRLNTSEQEQIWILISGVNGKFMSTYKDTVQIAKKSKREILDMERQKQEGDREYRVNYYYKYLQEYEHVRMCPSISEYFFLDKVNSIHIRKMDSVYIRKDKNDTTVFYKYRFSANNKNIDSVTAVKMAIAVASECYGSSMTPFMVRSMGDNKKYWMIYCFPTIPDNIGLQKNCYNLRTLQYERGELFHLSTGCPIVFLVLIARENGQVLTVKTP